MDPLSDIDVARRIKTGIVRMQKLPGNPTLALFRAAQLHAILQDLRVVRELLGLKGREGCFIDSPALVGSEECPDDREGNRQRAKRKKAKRKAQARRAGASLAQAAYVFSNTDGPQPSASGCINVRTTLRVRKQAASLNRQRVRKIDTLRPRTLKQPEGCGPSESAICPFHTACEGRGPLLSVSP